MPTSVLVRKIRSARIRGVRAARRTWMAARWNLRWTRAVLRTHYDPGVTVVIANYNGIGLLPVTIGAIRQFSPPEVRIIVVDNASTDDSREWLRERDDIHTVLNRRNVNHAPALDRGFHLATTEFVVALDSDAFPISSTWLDVLLLPLREGMVVSGANAYLDFAHPCAFATRTKDFARRRLSFRARLDPRGVDGVFDVGQAISADLPGLVGLIPITSREESGFGHVYGDAIYHNFYGTRASIPSDPLDPCIERPTVWTMWDLAVERYLGHDFGDT